MVASFSLAVLLASASALLVRADVTPTAPGPGDVFKEGSTCHIAWTGDSSSTTAWQNMAIELMTGDNFNMVFLTTVATGQDGTKDGTFDYPCPSVTPNSAIYFYQFIAPATTDVQWATRFTIASSSGATTDPANATQTNGDKIPWGTGALADPSTAVAAPSFASGSSSSGSGSASVSSASSTSASSSSSSISSSSSSSASSSVSSSASRNVAATAGSSPSGTSGDNAAASAASSAPSTSSTNSNAAISSLVLDYRLGQAALALVGSAMAFTLFL